MASRTTRGQAQRTATKASARAIAERIREEEEEARGQAQGPDGRQTLHDRFVEASEASTQLLAAVAQLDPGFFEQVRDNQGRWLAGHRRRT